MNTLLQNKLKNQIEFQFIVNKKKKQRIDKFEKLKAHIQRNKNIKHINRKIYHLFYNPYIFVNAYIKINKNSLFFPPILTNYSIKFGLCLKKTEKRTNLRFMLFSSSQFKKKDHLILNLNSVTSNRLKKTRIPKIK